MRIAYHFVTPEPPHHELDGAVQEALRLQERFGGSVHFLYPGRSFRPHISPSLAGLNRLPFLRALDREVDLHHVFLDRLRHLPFTRWVEKPWIATVLTSQRKVVTTLPRTLRTARALIVPFGTENGYSLPAGGPVLEAIRPGLDLSPFTLVPPPPATGSFHLLAGSAPWTLRQFKTKGFNALIETAHLIPELAITFLWRGLHANEARRSIASNQLETRVKIIDRKIDVAKCLESMHAGVALTRHPHLLKAYPHSLIEALAARRPVISSSCLAISRLVSEAGCGIVASDISKGTLTRSLRLLIDNYAEFRDNTRRVDTDAFSRENFLASYETIYRRALSFGSR